MAPAFGAEALTGSHAKWTLRAVPCTCRQPIRFPIIAKMSRRAKVREPDWKRRYHYDQYDRTSAEVCRDALRDPLGGGLY